MEPNKRYFVYLPDQFMNMLGIYEDDVELLESVELYTDTNKEKVSREGYYDYIQIVLKLR